VRWYLLEMRATDCRGAVFGTRERVMTGQIHARLGSALQYLAAESQGVADRGVKARAG
jgi:hypothetical protein